MAAVPVAGLEVEGGAAAELVPLAPPVEVVVVDPPVDVGAELPEAPVPEPEAPDSVAFPAGNGGTMLTAVIGAVVAVVAAGVVETSGVEEGVVDVVSTTGVEVDVGVVTDLGVETTFGVTTLGTGIVMGREPAFGLVVGVSPEHEYATMYTAEQSRPCRLSLLGEGRRIGTGDLPRFHRCGPECP